MAKLEKDGVLDKKKDGRYPDEACLKQIKSLPTKYQEEAIDKFLEKDPKTIHNVSGFFIGIVKRLRNDNNLNETPEESSSDESSSDDDDDDEESDKSEESEEEEEEEEKTQQTKKEESSDESSEEENDDEGSDEEEEDTKKVDTES